MKSMNPTFIKLLKKALATHLFLAILGLVVAGVMVTIPKASLEVLAVATFLGAEFIVAFLLLTCLWLNPLELWSVLGGPFLVVAAKFVVIFVIVSLIYWYNVIYKTKK